MAHRLIPPDNRESIPLTEAAARVVKRGIEAARAGRRDEALKLFDEALTINEDDVEALLWRGALSTPNAALPFLERAVALAPSSQRAHDGLAWARQRVGLVAPPLATRVRARDTAVGKVSDRSESPDVLRLLLPDIAGVIGVVQTFMVARQAAVLLAIVMFLAMLATGAMARAGINKDDSLVSADQPAITVGASATRPAPTATATKAARSVAQAAPTATASKEAKSTSKVTPAPTPAILTLDQSWAAQDWPQAIAAIDGELQRLPGDAALIAKKLKAHYNYGMQLVSQDRLTDAVREFDKALAIDAMNADVQSEKSHAILYRDGSAALADKDYDLAIPSLRTLVESAPGYREAKPRLYQAYLGYAAELEQSGKRSDAWTYYQKAAYVDAKGAEAEAALARLQGDAPAAVKAGKKIEVNLTKQQIIVWENNQVRWRFAASTGVSKAPTRAGNFAVLTKMPYATNDALGWGMPYWLGIYQAGGTEDGFHAMLQRKDGTTVSTSVLGRPYTNGCIMLSDPDEKMLYDWAEVGTPVWIHY